MKQLSMPVALQIITPIDPNIDYIEDLSDGLIKRARVHFKNGYQLSVVSGFGTYGNGQGLFEIAIFDTDDNWSPELFENYEEGDDDVLGHQSVEDVKFYIDKIGNLKANEP